MIVLFMMLMRKEILNGGDGGDDPEDWVDRH